MIDLEYFIFLLLLSLFPYAQDILDKDSMGLDQECGGSLRRYFATYSPRLETGGKMIARKENPITFRVLITGKPTKPNLQNRV